MYSDNLKNIFNPPRQLYAQGNIDCLKEPMIAIIGSRNCSEKGKKLSFQFAMQLAIQGVGIISGMAERY